MVLEIISYEKKEDIPPVINCTDGIADIALQLIKELKVSSFEAYAILQKSNNKAKGYSEVVWNYYEALDDDFTWSEAKKVASKLKVPESSAHRYISIYIDNDMLLRVRHNHYKK